jgi:hypothetical protein
MRRNHLLLEPQRMTTFGCSTHCKSAAKHANAPRVPTIFVSRWTIRVGLYHLDDPEWLHASARVHCLLQPDGVGASRTPLGQFVLCNPTVTFAEQKLE